MTTPSYALIDTESIAAFCLQRLTALEVDYAAIESREEALQHRGRVDEATLWVKFFEDWAREWGL